MPPAGQKPLYQVVDYKNGKQISVRYDEMYDLEDELDSENEVCKRTWKFFSNRTD